MRLQLTGLWQHSGFRRLWLGQTVSAIGSQVTSLALPLAAVLVLEATPTQMGVLEAVGSLPALALALFAGVWVDRVRRRPLLIASDLARAMLIGSVPLAAALGLLRVEHLYLVALGMGGLSLVYGLAHQAFLPSLIGREALMDGYGKLELSRSAAEIAGPGLAGALVQAVTAPLALVVDAFSFLVSALFVTSIGGREPQVEGRPADRSWGASGRAW